MSKKEILFITCLIVLICGIYFFMRGFVVSKPKSYISYAKPAVDRVQQRRDALQRQDRAMEDYLKRNRTQLERQREKIKGIMDYQNEYVKAAQSRIAKLPPSKRNDQKEILKAFRQETEVYMYKKMPGQVHTLPKINK